MLKIPAMHRLEQNPLLQGHSGSVVTETMLPG